MNARGGRDMNQMKTVTESVEMSDVPLSHVLLSFPFHRYPAANFKIYFGVEALYVSTPFVSDRNVSRIVVHPNFNPATFDNDVALLQLSSPIAFSSHIRPVCLAAPRSKWNAGTSCWVTGWGRIKTNSRNLFCYVFCFFYRIGNTELLFQVCLCLICVHVILDFSQPTL